MDDVNDLSAIFEKLSPSDYFTAKMLPDRPYDGQPHTDTGERGRCVVRGLTFRDLRDCYIIGCYQASTLPAEQYPPSLYDLPWEDMDPLAVFKNMSCEIERRMGIFPNIPPIQSVDPDGITHVQE